ncbi:MAG: DUF1330 domain-containing protein [Gammaproteobacteria bacterium]|nr:DUF1330 domain-containing protein [Gammaproteobacteria bacterium]MCF6258584.1 DUF1330 domain-containing protein [Gammaproteobacteria bacterium]
MNDSFKNTKTLLWVEVTSSPDREAAKTEYLQKAGPITAKHGGQPLNTFKVSEALGHRNALQIAVLFSFPNEQAIHNLFSDPEYGKLLPIRAKAFSQIRYTILEEIEA